MATERLRKICERNGMFPNTQWGLRGGRSMFTPALIFVRIREDVRCWETLHEVMRALVYFLNLTKAFPSADNRVMDCIAQAECRPPGRCCADCFSEGLG